MLIGRRLFLQGMALLTGGLFINKLDILLPKAEALQKFTPIGKFRLIAQYDIDNGLDFIRYDIFARDTQYYCGRSVSVADMQKINKSEYIEKYHKPIVKAMEHLFIENKISVMELKTIPYPANYTQPEWFRRLIA